MTTRLIRHPVEWPHAKVIFHGISVLETISLEVIVVLLLRLGAVLKLDRVVVMTGISSGCLCMISIEKSPPQVVGVQPKAEDE